MTNNPFFLIADDSQAKRMMLVAMIKKSHWALEIIEAKTTEEAKKMIDEHAPIVAAFIDYEIPSEQGPAVISYLKKKQPKARIALVSSADSTEYKENARAAGAEAFICTSFDLETVTQRLQDTLHEWAKATQE